MPNDDQLHYRKDKFANDGGVQNKLVDAKNAIVDATNFQSSVNRQAGIVPQVANVGQGHGVGQSFAGVHGNDHQGGLMPSQPAMHTGPNEINEALKWRSQQIAQNPDILDYNK